MLSKQELQEKLSTIINAMPEHIKQGISVEFDRHQPLHGTIDVIILKGDECLALGRYQEVRNYNSVTERETDFMNRFKMAMGYHTEPWYLFGFDGEKLVINDLSNHKYEDDFPATLESGIRKLLMTPQEFLAEHKTINDMKRFLDALNNNVN